MAGSDGRVVIDTQLNNSGFTRGVRGLRGQLGGLQSVASRLGAVLAGVFAVGALVNFGKECIELGSNVAEVQNVVDTAFGDMSYKIEQFADTAIQQFGMSRLAAKKTASTYMAMAKGMGIANEAASDMAIALTGLTGDVASFYNISQEAADTKLKSVFTGETESLKELGVVMTQANLKAFALEQGIKKDLAAMSQAELVALRYNYVMHSLSLTHGDFAKTADSWANQTRILSMQWQEFMSVLGSSLTRILLPCVKVLNYIVSALISVANAFSATLNAVFGSSAGQLKQTASAASEINDATAGTVDNQNALTSAVKETAKAEQKALAGFDEINKLSGEAVSGASVGGDTSVDIGTVGTTFELDEASVETTESIIKWLEDVLLRLQETADKLDFSNAAAAFGRLKDAASELVDIIGRGLGWAYDNVLEPALVWAVNTALPAAIDLIAEVVDLVANFLALLAGDITFAEFIGDLSPAQTALLGIAAAFVAIKVASAGIAAFEAITGFISAVKALKATSLIGKLAEVFLLTASGAGTLHEAMMLVFGKGSILMGVGAVVGGAVMAVTNFLSMLENGFSWVNEALMVVGIAIAAVGAVILGAPALVAGVVAAIVAAIATAVVLIKEHWSSIREFFAGLWEAIKNVFGNVADWFREKFTAAWTAVKNVFSDGGKIFDGIKAGILSGLKAVVNAIIAGINKVISVPFTGLNKALTKIKGVDILGLKPFNWIKTISIPRIPKLAKGAVIPPNREFLAVLGDQKSGTNIEAPLSTIQEAVATVMGDMFQGQMAGFEAVVSVLKEILEAVYGIEIGDEVIAKAAQRYRDKMAVVKGGV